MVGNSRTAVTAFEDETGDLIGTVPTAAVLSGDVSALGLRPDLKTLVVSVVPEATAILACKHPDVQVLRAEDAPIAIRYEPPSGLGTDRLANALAARALFGAPVLAVDCGTATTLTLVNAQGELAGGAIALGLGSSRDALAARTAQLPEVPLAIPPTAIGLDTRTAMQVGLVLGHAGMIAHLAERMAPGVPIVMTGGWSSLLVDLVPGAIRHGNLTAWGGKVYWESRRSGS